MNQSINKNSWNGATGYPDKHGNTTVTYEGTHISSRGISYIFSLSLLTLRNRPSTVTLKYEDRILNTWENHHCSNSKVIDSLGTVTSRCNILSIAANFAVKYVELCEDLGE